MTQNPMDQEKEESRVHHDRERRIREEMEINKVSEAEARFRVAIEFGVIPGDVLPFDDAGETAD